MNESSQKRTRGRPKKINRTKILDITMKSYWEEGIPALSLNEICRRTNTSKPGVYREFGNEDGLMKAALEQYQREVLSPLHNFLLSSLSIEELTQKLVIAVKSGVNRPRGCLFVKMKDVEADLGEKTRKELMNCHTKTLDIYKQLAEKLIKNKSISSHLSPQLISKYMNVQINNASALLSRGEDIQDVEAILMLSFSALLNS